MTIVWGLLSNIIRINLSVLENYYDVAVTEIFQRHLSVFHFHLEFFRCCSSCNLTRTIVTAQINLIIGPYPTPPNNEILRQHKRPIFSTYFDTTKGSENSNPPPHGPCINIAKIRNSSFNRSIMLKFGIQL